MSKKFYVDKKKERDYINNPKCRLREFSKLSKIFQKSNYLLLMRKEKLNTRIISLQETPESETTT